MRWLRQQALLHDLACLHEKLAEQARRNIGALADLLGQHAILLGALDQVRERALRQFRRVIGRQSVCHVAVAARYQNIGQRLVEARPRR